eukprot:3357802-Rhodomonas_salina.2
MWHRRCVSQYLTWYRKHDGVWRRAYRTWHRECVGQCRTRHRNCEGGYLVLGIGLRITLEQSSTGERDRVVLDRGERARSTVPDRS